jgi:hypothetical protein
MQSPFDDEPLPIPPPKDHLSVFPSLPDSFTSSPTSTSKPLGTLVVVVLKARHLVTASSSRWTKQSPYACLTLHTAPLPASPDAMSIMSSETGKLRRRKGSGASSRERRTSLGSIPPPERAATVDKLRTKMEKERAKTISRTTLVATPEEDVLPPVEVDVEEEFDHKAALCTPVDPRGGQHPVWDSELRFPLTEAIVEGRRMVNIEIWAKVGLGRSDRLLGSARLDVEKAIAGGTMDGKCRVNACSESKLLKRSFRMGSALPQRRPARRGLPQPHLLRVATLADRTAPLAGAAAPAAGRAERDQLAPLAARDPAPHPELQPQVPRAQGRDARVGAPQGRVCAADVDERVGWCRCRLQ